MRGRFYIRITGCDCGCEHTIVDPDYYYTLARVYEVPQPFNSEKAAFDHGAEFIEWQAKEGGHFNGFEVVGIN